MSILSRLSFNTWNIQQKGLTYLLRSFLHKKHQAKVSDKYQMEETAKNLRQVYDKSVNVVKAK